MEKKILIVDDDTNIITLLKNILVDEGFEVFTAESGIEGLEVFNNNDLKMAFIDLQMPRMNGIDLCKTIREKNDNIWLCAITGVSELFQMETCKDSGFNNYLTKPLDLERIIEEANEAHERLKQWN